MSKARCEVANGMAVCDANADSREAFRLAAEEQTDMAYSPGQAVRVAAGAVKVAAGAVRDGYSAAVDKWGQYIDKYDKWASGDWPWYLYPFKLQAKMASFVLNGNKTVITRGVDAAIGIASLPFQYIDNVEKARGDGVTNPFMTGGLMLVKDMGIGMYEQAKGAVTNWAEAPIDLLVRGDVSLASRKWSSAIFDIGMVFLGVKGAKAAAVGAYGKANSAAMWLARNVDNGGFGGGAFATNTGVVLADASGVAAVAAGSPGVGPAGMLAMAAAGGEGDDTVVKDAEEPVRREGSNISNIKRGLTEFIEQSRKIRELTKRAREGDAAAIEELAKIAVAGPDSVRGLAISGLAKVAEVDGSVAHNLAQLAIDNPSFANLIVPRLIKAAEVSYDAANAAYVLMRRIEETKPDLAAALDAGIKRAAKIRGRGLSSQR